MKALPTDSKTGELPSMKFRCPSCNRAAYWCDPVLVVSSGSERAKVEKSLLGKGRVWPKRTRKWKRPR